jgi:carbon storage regulator
MLVLSRELNQGITIQHPMGNVHVTVIRIGSDKVRLGIEAEKGVPVHRDEVWKAIEQETKKKDGDLSALQDKLDHEENQVHGN